MENEVLQDLLKNGRGLPTADQDNESIHVINWIHCVWYGVSSSLGSRTIHPGVWLCGWYTT